MLASRLFCPACRKGKRALVYCRDRTCPGPAGLVEHLSAMPDLPAPDVNVTTNGETGKTHVVVSRDGKGRSYEVEGDQPNTRIADAVRKVLSDPYSGEWIPRK